VHRLKRKEKFLRGLSGANAYILGSHEGCGCGFILDELSDPEDRAASEDSRRRLCEYVDAVVRGEASVVLLAAWQGDEGKPPVRDAHVRLGGGDLRHRNLFGAGQIL